MAIIPQASSVEEAPALTAPAGDVAGRVMKAVRSTIAERQKKAVVFGHNRLSYIRRLYFFPKTPRIPFFFGTGLSS